VFNAEACFPLSPKSEKTNPRDQLEVILEILGQQTADDFSFISGGPQARLLTKINARTPKLRFDKEFPYSSTRITGLLHKLL